MIFNTREDLESAVGTPEHKKFMEYLSGSIAKQTNVQVYPENYNTPEYDGSVLEPIWEETQDYSVIESFGFTAEDFK